MAKTAAEALEKGYTEAIRDSLWGHIYLTPELKALTESSAFLRLHRILQLGPVFRIYPGATHTRAGHSIGVYHTARRLLKSLSAKGADSWISREGVFSFLCACLLHDLGHFPYAHSLKELPLESHEALTAALILREPLSGYISTAGGDPKLTAAIIDTSLPADGDEILFYRKLLSGVLDPDKLDYLNRDAQYCGVPYGAQDVDFILSRLEPHKNRGVDIDSRGIPSVESILFSKYLMYRAVYWQHSVRSATAMVKKALMSALENKWISPGELYGLDDQGLFLLMENRKAESSALCGLTERIRSGSLYQSVFEFHFAEKKHGSLADLEKRAALEKELASGLAGILKTGVSSEEVIIDLPERISFESGLFVKDENKFFGESSSAFKPEMVEAFAESLRIIRIFADPALSVTILEKKNLIYEAVLKLTEKWA